MGLSRTAIKGRWWSSSRFLMVTMPFSFATNVKNSRVRVHHGASVDSVPPSPCWSCVGRHALSC